MEFLGVFAIKKLAARKGYVAERAGVVKGRTYVQLTDDRGRMLDGSDAGGGETAA